MTDIQRVLAATDLSAPARHAAERAALLPRELGASLDLLHVISASPLDRLAPARRGPGRPRSSGARRSVTRYVLQTSQGDVLVSLGAPLLTNRAA